MAGRGLSSCLYVGAFEIEERGKITPMRLPLVLWFLAASFLEAQAPDLVFHNAKVVTVDAGFSIAQALAVRGDRIVAVGTDREILALAGAGTRKIDLGGRTVLPGLADSHTHAVDAALFEFDHPVPDMETMADVLA